MLGLMGLVVDHLLQLERIVRFGQGDTLSLSETNSVDLL